MENDEKPKAKPKLSNVFEFRPRAKPDDLGVLVCTADHDGQECGCMFWLQYTDGTSRCVLCGTDYDDNDEMLEDQ